MSNGTRSIKGRLFTAALFAATLLSGCAADHETPSDAGKKTLVYASIPPIAFFVERIAGEFADVRVFLGPGKSPVTFEPTARQLTRMARARVFFSIGLPFEKMLLPRLRSNFSSLEIVDAGAGINTKGLGPEYLVTESMPPGGEPKGTSVEDTHTHGNETDPHVWMSPRNAKTIARNICETLVRIDPAMSDSYEANYSALVDDLDQLDAEISEMLAPLEGTEIVVFHAAYGHFAKAYGLVQLAIETGGAAPGSKYLAGLLESARARGVKAIFVQPQFSRSTAETIAQELGAEVISIDPLSADYLATVRDLAIKILSVYKKG